MGAREKAMPLGGKRKGTNTTVPQEVQGEKAPALKARAGLQTWGAVWIAGQPGSGEVWEQLPLPSVRHQETG